MLDRGVDEALEQLGRIFPPGPFLDRRLGRALAFQALYEMDMGHHAPGQVLDRLAESFQESGAAPYSPEVLDDAAAYARALVRGVLLNRAAIDGLIQQRAPLWPLAQMSAVDRNVLRIGLFESLYGNATVPLRTAINEAVELAKLFGSETSAKFVNGVLGRAVEASASGEWPSAESSPPSGPNQPGSRAAPLDEAAPASGAQDNHPAT
jgi:transcription antitermination protein NusB